MGEVHILSACSIAFLAVFVLLAFLAVVMQLIMAVFPERKAVLDSVMVAAIFSTVSTLIPGARVTRIEEES